MIIALYIAGVLQLLIASANFFAPRKLKYAENLARLDRTVRDIFVILCLYIVLILVAFAVLCFVFPHELTSGSALSRSLCGFLALFWGLRVVMQLVHYNAEIKKKHPVFNAMFLTSFVILTIIFTTAAVR